MDELGPNPPAIPELPIGSGPPPAFGGPPPIPPTPPAPPPAALPPLPWEQSGYPFFAALFETTRLFLTRPREAYARSSPTVGNGRPLLYGSILSFVFNIVTATYEFLMRSAMDSMTMHGYMEKWLSAETSIPPVARLLGTIFASPFVIPLCILLVAGLVHLCLLLLGGAPGGFAATLKSLAYSNAPVFLAIVPVCGSIAGLIWGIVIGVIGLTVVHRISTGKAVAAILLPIFVCCACLSPFLFLAGMLHK
jgi:hypothetical protein